VDSGSGFAVELLVDDGLDERLEGGLLGGEAYVKGAGFGDEFCEFGVGGGERGRGFGGVVGELAGWAGAGARHGEKCATAGETLNARSVGRRNLAGVWRMV